jgi:hypothetical protein
LALTATAISTLVTKRAKAISGFTSPPLRIGRPRAAIKRAAPSTERIAIPETGEFDEPISPAM